MYKKKVFIVGGIILILAISIYLFLGKSKKSSLILETGKVEIGTIINSVTATGTVEPVTEVEVGTQVSGIIAHLYADYNDVVKAGQLIAEMDKINLTAELKASEAQLASSKSEYEYQQKNYVLILAVLMAGISGLIAQHFLQICMNPFLIAFMAKHPNATK